MLSYANKIIKWKNLQRKKSSHQNKIKVIKLQTGKIPSNIFLTDFFLFNQKGHEIYYPDCNFSILQYEPL